MRRYTLCQDTSLRAGETCEMQTMTNSFRSLSLIWELHRDTILMTGAIAVGLVIGATVGSFFVQTL